MNARAATASGPRLILLEGPGPKSPRGTTEVVLAEQATLEIGRVQPDGLQLEGRGVSRHHCTVIREGDHVRVVDAGSHNGTFVNGRPVRDQLLDHGDQLRVSTWRLLFLWEAKQTQARVPASGSSSTVTQTQVLEAEPRFEDTVAHVSEAPARQLDALLRLAGWIDDLVAEGTVPRQLRSGMCAAFGADRFDLWWVGPALEDLGDAWPTWADEWLDRRAPSLLVRESPEGEHEVLWLPLVEPSAGAGVVAQVVGHAVLSRARGPAPCWDAQDLRLGAAFALQLRTAAARLREKALRATVHGSDLLVGESAEMVRVRDTVARVAPARTPVLLRGPSGSGKEAVARSLHRHSDRADGPFVALNCAAISPQLLESELFGHERGAFTGAIERRVGRLEQAHGGTLLLDEIGEMSPELQAKLLRVLQDMRFERVGGHRTLEVDVRVLSATNRDLEEAIREGAFREDLYYRLNVLEIFVPGLAERGEDVVLLAHHFLDRLRAKTPREVHGFTARAVRLLRSYGWPGNVRELRHAVEHALVLGDQPLLDAEDLPSRMLESRPREGGFHARVRASKREIILHALEAEGGNVAAAARRLELAPTYLHRLMTQLELRSERGPTRD